MKKAYKYIALIIIILAVNIIGLKGENQIVVATANDNKTIKEAIAAYKKNSLSCQKVEAEQKLNISIYLQYKNNLKQYKDQIEKFQGDTKEFQNLLKAYEECLLNVNLYEYYQKNSDKMIAENQSKEIYNFLQDFLMIPVYKANIKYYKELIKELKEELVIAEAKFKQGYFTTLEVERIKSKIKTEEANLNAIEGEQSSLEAKINMEISLTGKSGFSLYKLAPIQKKDKYVKAYLTDSPLLFQKQKEKAYTVYRENVTKKVNDSSSYIEKADNNLKIIDIEMKQYKNQIESTVTGFTVTYNNIASQLIAKEEEIKVINLEITNYEKLYQKGRIQKLELTKSSTEKARLEYEKMVLLYKQNMVYYGLHYHILE
jgi:hypothetical protein